MNREQIGARLRFEILRRCNFACYYCGTPAAFGMKRATCNEVFHRGYDHGRNERA